MVNFEKYEPEFHGNTKTAVVPKPLYLLDPKDPKLETILMISDRYDDDWYLFQRKLHILSSYIAKGIQIDYDEFFRNHKITAYIKKVKSDGTSSNRGDDKGGDDGGDKDVVPEAEPEGEVESDEELAEAA
jgi:hypothetical protein